MSQSKIAGSESGPTGLQIASARLNMELSLQKMYFEGDLKPRMVSTGLDGVILWLLAAERANCDDPDMLALLETGNFPCLKRKFDPKGIHVELAIAHCPSERQLAVLERVFRYSKTKLPTEWPLKLEYRHALDPHNHGTFEENSYVRINCSISFQDAHRPRAKTETHLRLIDLRPDRIQQPLTVTSVNPMELVTNAFTALSANPVALNSLERDNNFIIASLIGRIHAILRSRETSNKRLENNKPFSIDMSLLDLSRLFSNGEQYRKFSRWSNEVVAATNSEIKRAETWINLVTGQNEDDVRRLQQLGAVFNRLSSLFNRASLNEISYSTRVEAVRKVPSYPVNPHEAVSRRPFA